MTTNSKPAICSNLAPFPNYKIGGDPRYAGRYAQISYDALQQRYVILDLQSPTGVWLNGVRIAPNLPAPLLPGMMIALGKDTPLLFG